MISIKFAVNLRETLANEGQLGTFTVHRFNEPESCQWGAIDKERKGHWAYMEKWESVSKIANLHPLGACEKCWPNESVALTAKLGEEFRRLGPKAS